MTDVSAKKNHADIAKAAMAKLTPEEQEAMRVTTLGAITAVQQIWMGEADKLAVALRQIEAEQPCRYTARCNSNRCAHHQAHAALAAYEKARGR